MERAAWPLRSANSTHGGPGRPGQVDVMKTPARMLIQEGDVASHSKYATMSSPASSTWKSEISTNAITQDGTNATPTLNLGSGSSMDHARDSPMSSITPSIHKTPTRVDST